MEQNETASSGSCREEKLATLNRGNKMLLDGMSSTVEADMGELAFGGCLPVVRKTQCTPTGGNEMILLDNQEGNDCIRRGSGL